MIEYKISMRRYIHWKHAARVEPRWWLFPHVVVASAPRVLDNNALASLPAGVFQGLSIRPTKRVLGICLSWRWFDSKLYRPRLGCSCPQARFSWPHLREWRTALPPRSRRECRITAQQNMIRCKIPWVDTSIWNLAARTEPRLIIAACRHSFRPQDTSKQCLDYLAGGNFRRPHWPEPNVSCSRL